MEIPRHFETEEEYRAYPALSSSILARYWNEGIYSPDHALMKFEAKSYFEYGKMFETLLQDTVKGTDEFFDRFFVSGIDATRPDELVQWIDNGDDLEQHYVYTKKGDLHGTYKGRHAFLDECIAHPGKIPVSKKELEDLKIHVERMCEMPYLNVPCGDLLAKGEWQVGIRWKCPETGVEKKALKDVTIDLGGESLVIDIKTAVDPKKFGHRLNDHYWIQDMHYTEGENETTLPSMQVLFLVAYKTAPKICQPWTVDYGDTDWKIKALEEYRELCESFSKWNRKARGWLPMATKKLYLKK